MAGSNHSLFGFVALAAIGVLAVIALSATDENRGGPKDGSPAVAHILRAGDGDCTVGVKRQHCYALELEVHAEGSPSFETSIDVNIEDRWASRIQPGSWISVVRDRTDPARVLVNVEAFADPAPTPPER